MDDTTQQALDGTRDAAALTPDQRARLVEAEQLIAAVVATVPSEPMPDLGPAVLRAIAATRQEEASKIHPLASWWQWFWRPRPITLRWRPIYALAAPLAVVAVVLVALVGRPTRQGEAGSASVLTRFELAAPGAHRVTLAGGFTNWQPDIELTQGARGTWTVVIPLEPGIHSYAFVIDGERWIADPASPAYDDGFGGQNSRLALLPPDGVLQ